jgi:DNA adenine methylase
MYDWAYGIYDKEWNYTINRTDDQRKEENKNKNDEKEYGKRDKGKEVFIVNYDSINIEQLDMFEVQSA